MKKNFPPPPQKGDTEEWSFTRNDTYLPLNGESSCTGVFFRLTQIAFLQQDTLLSVYKYFCKYGNYFLLTTDVVRTRLNKCIFSIYNPIVVSHSNKSFE